MKLSRRDAKALGLDVPQDRQNRGKKPGWTKGAGKQATYAGNAIFDDLCRAHGLPLPQSEFVFAPPRKWRFDHLFDGWLALEIEGGVFSGGAHVRGEHFLSDMEKYNEAVILGFCVIRCTPADIESGAAFALVRRALASREEQP